jgi:hypothetical protein
MFEGQIAQLADPETLYRRPASRNIGGTEIKDHRTPQRRGQSLPVPDLDRKPRLRPMQNRLAMKADQVDGAEIKALVPAKALHSLGMSAGEEGFGLGQNAGTADGISQATRISQSRPEQPPLSVRIGPRRKAAEKNPRFPIGLDKSNIDPVEGRAGHQAYGAQLGHR